MHYIPIESYSLPNWITRKIVLKFTGFFQETVPKLEI